MLMMILNLLLFSKHNYEQHFRKAQFDHKLELFLLIVNIFSFKYLPF